MTKTILAIQKYKSLDIIGSNEYNISMCGLENIFTSLHDMLFPIQNNQNFDSEQHINKLQDITVELSGLFKTYGTEHIDDLITICFGSDFIKNVLKKKDIIDKISFNEKICTSHRLPNRFLGKKVKKKIRIFFIKTVL